jgi:hypothetical protein
MDMSEVGYGDGIWRGDIDVNCELEKAAKIQHREILTGLWQPSVHSDDNI